MSTPSIGSIGISTISDASFKQSSNINQTNQGFDWGKKLDAINATKESLLHNTQKLAKKRTVEEVGVFSANIGDKTSLASKVAQIWENIKMKCSNLEKSISKDCAKLKNLLTEGVTASLGGGDLRPM